MSKDKPNLFSANAKKKQSLGLHPKPYFDKVDPKADFPKIEEDLIDYWKKNKIFEKSIKSRPIDKSWTFLDGPPFITGTPHYGSLLSSIPKDLFPRYYTMKGYRVRRVWGWDCHGLPAENKVESKLGIERKRDIEEKIGVDKFIEECKLYVSEVSGEWEWYVDHIARWVDFKNAYKTMDTEYMESVMWVFKQMYEKDLIYKGIRVSLYCPHCGTPISNFEVAMDADNYKEITEASNVYKYRLTDQKDTYILAWSTTPWNKIVTPALAINPKLKYIKVKQGDEYYILAESTKDILKDEPYKIVEEIKGADLVGMKFEPHYDFYEIESGKKAFEVLGADFVTAEEGTGVVTIAAYGEDDLALMKAENIQIVLHVDDEGHLKDDVPNWAGMYYLKVNKLVNNDLNKRGLMYKEESYKHTVPTCWRCHTRLFYAPQDAWYVNVQSLKGELYKTNEYVNWVPSHFKHGRFLKSMEAAPDWNISRTRYWGSPVPVWECSCGERYVPGSIKELEDMSGEKVKDLHKPEIDNVKITCTKCGKEAERVPEVLDSWIEAGSASLAERHYPFENKKDLNTFFPPDFIIEYTGQIRAWFYVLHVIANALKLREQDDKNKLAENVLVTGVILGTDGRKMSKNFGNYPDPKEMIKKYGGDALRLYLMGSNVMRAEDIVISEDHYKEQIRSFILTLWNVYNFFVLYANIDGWKPEHNSNQSDNVLDLWINSRLNLLVNNTTKNLDKYNTVEYVSDIKEFVNDLSNWYIRRSRDRVGPTALDMTDKENFYNSAFVVLTKFTRLIAPITPFLAEIIYTNLTKDESVHLTDWPKAGEIDKKLIMDMTFVREIVEKGHASRKKEGIPVRQPLAKLTVSSPNDKPNEELLELLKKELNIKKIQWRKAKELDIMLDMALTESLKEEAKVRELIREIQKERRKLGTDLNQYINLALPWLPKSKKNLDNLKNKVLAKNIKKADKLVVKPL